MKTIVNVIESIFNVSSKALDDLTMHREVYKWIFMHSFEFSEVYLNIKYSLFLERLSLGKDLNDREWEDLIERIDGTYNIKFDKNKVYIKNKFPGLSSIFHIDEKIPDYIELDKSIKITKLKL